ncbi:MAG TPA: hypothetical protein PKD86_15100 [Gemmatales bacterium]|nr:hypothetical protein [Gemmatales bacterium]HMP60670.1 hypothetical protein [Gemmatales bacterium]
MNLLVLTACLGGAAAEPPVTAPPLDLKIDLRPLREPLDRAAAACERALAAIENFKADLFHALNLALSAAASLVTAVLMLILQQLGLSAGGDDQPSSAKTERADL